MVCPNDSEGFTGWGSRREEQLYRITGVSRSQLEARRRTGALGAGDGARSRSSQVVRVGDGSRPRMGVGECACCLVSGERMEPPKNRELPVAVKKTNKQKLNFRGDPWGPPTKT